MKRTALFLLLCMGCSDDAETPTSDVSSDVKKADFGRTDVPTDTPDSADMTALAPFMRTATQPGVSPDGNTTLDAPLGDDEARVGKTSSDEGFHGVFAHCKPGDYKLYNNLVEFCVQGIETNRFEFFHGGGLVDMRLVGDTKEDIFDIWLPRYDLNVLDVQKIYVVSDGSDGGPAVLRADGVDAPIAQIVGAVGTSLARPLGLDISVEYRLHPNSSSIEILTWTSTTDGKKQTISVGETIGFGERVKIWSNEVGFDLAGISKVSSFIAQGEGHSFGWYREKPASLFTAVLELVPWLLAEDRKIVILEGEHATRRYLIVGDGTTNSITQEIQKIKKEEAHVEKTISIKYEDGTAAKGRQIELFDGQTHVAFAKTNNDGKFKFAKKTVTHFAVVPLFGEEERSINTNETDEYLLPTPALLAVRGSDLNSRISVSVTLKKGLEKKNYVVSSNDETSIEIAAGSYEVYIDRGMEWDIKKESVTLTGGESKQVDLLLTRVLDTTNYIAADFHQHMEPSIDSEVSVRDRILDNVGQGVEFVSPSDHEVVTDLGPYIIELGLEDEIGTVSGIEISPAHTHMNWFPIDYKVNARARGAVSLAVLKNGVASRRTIPEMIALGRQLPSAPIIQMNHGRGGSGYFNHVEFDPYTSTAMKPEDFTTDFDSMEILNDEDETCILIEDWSALLNIGLRPTAIGNSDSHGLWRAAGDSRNYISSSTDNPKDLDPQMIKQAVLQNQTTIARFALVDFPDAMPGDTISTDTLTTVDLRIRVQTPPYSQVDKIMVLANGTIIDQIDISSSVEDIVDYDAIYSRLFTEDTWITFVALGPNISNPINDGQLVFSMPNPIFIDVDGDIDSNGNMFEPVGAGSPDNKKIDISLLQAQMPVCTATRD